MSMSFETTERKFSLKYIISPCSLLLMDVEALMGWIHGHYVMKPDFRCLFMYFEIMVYLVYLRTASTMCHAYSSMCFFFLSIHHLRVFLAIWWFVVNLSKCVKWQNLFHTPPLPQQSTCYHIKITTQKKPLYGWDPSYLVFPVLSVFLH